MKLCKNCKAELEDNQKFCHRCGSNEFDGINADFSNNSDENLKMAQTENNADNINPAVTSSPVSKSIPSDNAKLIKIIIAVVAVIIVIVAILTAIALRANNKQESASSSSTTYKSTTTQENDETTQSKDMVPLISLCPTYEEFMDKLSSGVTDLTENTTDDGKHINATFDYHGYTVTVWYLKFEPHYIRSIMVSDITTSYGKSWISNCMADCMTILQLYLEDVPNADSTETISGKFSDGITNNTAKKESDGTTLKMSDSYTSYGIEYSYSGLTGPYLANYIQSVEIDESYEIEKPKDDTDTTAAKEETDTTDKAAEDETQNITTKTSADGTNDAANAPVTKSNTTAAAAKSSAKTTRTGNTTKASNSNPCANGHNWVAVTKTVHHGEEGHYETVTKYESVQKITCPCCTSTFDTYASYTTHFQKHINADPNTKYIMDSYGKTTVREPYTEKEWVVDAKAYDENVVTGYKCSVCGKTQ